MKRKTLEPSIDVPFEADLNKALQLMRKGKQKGSSLRVKTSIILNMDLPSFMLLTSLLDSSLMLTPICAFLTDAVESLFAFVKVEDITRVTH